MKADGSIASMDNFPSADVVIVPLDRQTGLIIQPTSKVEHGDQLASGSDSFATIVIEVVSQRGNRSSCGMTMTR